MKSFSRRDILKLGAAGLGSLLVSDEMKKIASAAERVTGPEASPSPVKKNHKINPPVSGCYVGFWTDWPAVANDAVRATGGTPWRTGRTVDETGEAVRAFWKPLKSMFVKKIDEQMRGYALDVGGKPYIFVNREMAKLWYGFDEELADAIADQGSIPLQYANLESTLNPSFAPKMKDVIAGKHDQMIASYARSSRAFGERRGGFFITTMHEPNLPKSWGSKTLDWSTRPEPRHIQ